MINGDEEALQLVHLIFFYEESLCVKTSPLQSLQIGISMIGNEYTIELCVYVTYDFVKALFVFGPELEVIILKSLHQEMKDKLMGALK